MFAHPPIRNAAIITFISLILLLALINNPYYSPPLPPSLSSLRFLPQSESTLDSYVSAPDRVHSAFQDVDVGHMDFREFNSRVLRDLHVCLALENCGRNQTQVVIFTGYWVIDAVVSPVQGVYVEQVLMVFRFWAVEVEKGFGEWHGQVNASY